MLKEQACAISTLTRAELRFGQACMSAEDRPERGLIDHFLLRLPNIEWTSQAANHSDRSRHWTRQGTPIGELDAQIAAHAMAEALILVTHNTRHFEKSGLET